MRWSCIPPSKDQSKVRGSLTASKSWVWLQGSPTVPQGPRKASADDSLSLESRSLKKILHNYTVYGLTLCECQLNAGALQFGHYVSQEIGNLCPTECAEVEFLCIELIKTFDCMWFRHNFKLLLHFFISVISRIHHLLVAEMLHRLHDNGTTAFSPNFLNHLLVLISWQRSLWDLSLLKLLINIGSKLWCPSLIWKPPY